MGDYQNQFNHIGVVLPQTVQLQWILSLPYRMQQVIVYCIILYNYGLYQINLNLQGLRPRCHLTPH